MDVRSFIQSINMILAEAHKYITELKQQNDEMLLHGGDKVQAEEIRRLRRQVEDLRRESLHYLELLKANGINYLDDATVHWKGKQGRAKVVAKVTPTPAHLQANGIVVYSDCSTNANTISVSTTAKQPGQHLQVPQQDKPAEAAVAVTVQHAAQGIRPLVHNGAQAQHVITSLPAPQHVPMATLVPAVTRIELTVLEQQPVASVAPVVPKLPPSVNYITLQSLFPPAAATARLPQQPLPVAPAPSLMSTASAAVPLPLPRLPTAGVALVPQAAESRLLPLDATSPSQTLQPSSNLLNTTGNTQTTWTTLHLAGNTVQPVCQTLCVSDGNGDGGGIAVPQTLSVCPVGMKPAAQPATIQIQPQAASTAPQVAMAVPVPPQSPQQQPTQLQPATVLSPPPSAILPQSTLVAHPVSVSKGQPVVMPALGPQVALLPQPVAPQSRQALVPLSSQPQPVLLPQQPAVLPHPQSVLLTHTKKQPILPQPQPTIVPQVVAAMPHHSAVTPQHQSVAAPQLPQPTILPQQPQPAIFPQPQTTVLSQPAVLPQQSIFSQPQTTLLPQTTILPQQPHTTFHSQPALLPQSQASVVAQPQPHSSLPGQQHQAAVLPVLQTMQVLQVNPAGATVAAAVSAAQSSSSPNVVFLQQAAGSCSTPQVIREDLNTSQAAQTTCQHIVIIQAPSQAPSVAPQAPQAAVVPAPMPILPSHVAVSGTHPTAQTQSAPGTKQLVQILPQLQSPAPQTISMNGQVYVLQPVTSPEKAAAVPAQVGQSYSADDPASCNVTLQTLGPLTANLNQTDPQASSQSIVQVHTIVPTSQAVVQSTPLPSTNLAVNSSVSITPTTHGNPSPSKQTKGKAKGTVKKIGPKRKPGRKPKPPRSKDVRIGLLPIAAKVTTPQLTIAPSQPTKQANPVRALKPSTAPALAPKTAVTSTETATVNSVTPGQDATAAVTKKSTAVVKSQVTAVTVATGSGVSSTTSSMITSAPVSVTASRTLTTVTSITKLTLKSTVTQPNTSISSVCTIASAPTVTTSSSNPCRSMPTPVSITPKAIAASKDSAKPSRSVFTAANSCSVVNISIDNGIQVAKATTAVSCVASIVKPTCSVVAPQPVGRDSPRQSTKVAASVGHSVPSVPPHSSVQDTASLVTSVVSATTKSIVTPSSSVLASPIPTTISSLVSSGPVNPTQSNQNMIHRQSNSSNLPSDSSMQLRHASNLPTVQMSCVEPTSQSVALQDRASHIHHPHEPRKREDHVSASRNQPLEVGLATLSSTPMNSAHLKLDSRKDKELVSVEKDHLVAVNPCPRKDSSLPHDVYTLEQSTLEQPLMSNRQTDSPLSAGGRGFSVASMLPPAGHSIGGSSHNSFGSFNFTPEQAEILALVTAWDQIPPKSQQASSSKDRNPEMQFKPNKHLDLPLAKTSSSSQSAVRCPPVEGAATRPNNRPPHSVSYSHSQSASVGSLNVSNLIRPSSCQPYPASPSLQASVSSPGVPTNLGSQPSSAAILPNCSVSGQLSDYPPKGNLMRSHVSVSERHLKELPKRPAQDDVMLTSNKRPKGCPSGNVGRMDVKGATDHSQMAIGQMTPNSSAVMTRINPEGSLFSSNSFMSTVLRPTDAQQGHHPSQMLANQEPSQPGVVHLQGGHPQHGGGGPPQSQQHIIGGNPYLKQQQQEQQRHHHLYQLQHHLTQSQDASQAQLHGIHQRSMQQQQDIQQQHVHKKRGMVRGAGQTGPPVGMQQKQHHLEKGGLQQHPPSQQHQQQQQQHQHPQQQQSHQQHQQQHAQQHHHQSQQQQQQQQQSQQLQQQSQHQPPQSHQQQQQQQSSHSRHQHLQQQIQQQQQQQHFGARGLQDNKACDSQPSGPRPHQQGSHLGQQQECQSGPDHGAVQRLMGSRVLEQQLTSQANSATSRSSDLVCAPSRQRLSSYSAEALIGKSTSSGGDQRMGLHLQAAGQRGGNNQEQADLRYLERSKGNINHNPSGSSRLPPDHTGSSEVQMTFKGNHQLGNFDAQASRAGDANNKSGPPVQRVPQVQGGTFRMGPPPGSGGEGRSRVPYSATHAGPQGMQIGVGLPREQDALCHQEVRGHQSFMQSLLAPHLADQTGHQRGQCCPPPAPVSLEYGSCVPGASAGDMQAKASSSPSLSTSQKASAMRLGDSSNKGHVSQVSGNLHGQVVRTGLSHPATTPQSNAEPGRNPAPSSSRPLSGGSQRTRHIGQEVQSSKIRPGERPRSAAVRPSDPFESEGSLPLQGVILGRSQASGDTRRGGGSIETGGETRQRGSIVRFMPDTSHVSNADNNLVSDQHQHLSQNFSFPFPIADGSMNPPPPPPPINTNSTFIPPVSQSGTSRTSLLPVEPPQNTLPSFYPSYSPAAHPSLPSDIPLQYFSNQMFTSSAPCADKSSAPPPLNNRFSSILSPPRAVGFAQASFPPLLPEMPPPALPIGNTPSAIAPHLPNFNLTSLFPEIATATMPPDGSSAMPMSPLLSLGNASAADSGKQSNRPAHNISHILGHDGSSAV
ncbi:basic helix-loop-helix domain-containing protein USF3 isoform X2 [Engraulis encrasicolus]|uniref:basic helix-loop-helix domain-containing protein USF3 isoform X2 n=1 Tax=Engraulis encrasicolus TaxID=184585 RepID=UPI002FCED363